MHFTTSASLLCALLVATPFQVAALPCPGGKCLAIRNPVMAVHGAEPPLRAPTTPHNNVNGAAAEKVPTRLCRRAGACGADESADIQTMFAELGMTMRGGELKYDRQRGETQNKEAFLMRDTNDWKSTYGANGMPLMAGTPPRTWKTIESSDPLFAQVRGNVENASPAGALEGRTISKIDVAWQWKGNENRQTGAERQYFAVVTY